MKTFIISDLFRPAACHAFLKTLFVIASFCLFGATTSAIALEFRENSETGEITANGKVEMDDAEKISKIITLEYKQRHHIVRGLATVSFDSQGGSMLGGLRLGYAMRALAVHTNIGAGQKCMSACALAFLGGQQRTVEGEFGVHAASLSHGKRLVERDVQLDSVQQLGAITTAYVNEMTGRSDVALRALSTSAVRISVLDDIELVSMGVITVARRPSQFGKTGFKCPPQHDFTVLSTVCAYMDIAQLDQKLNLLYSEIQKKGMPADLASGQEKWRRYRNSCINDGQPNGYESVVYCVREAYSVRHDQLMSIWLELTAKHSRPGLRKWQPLEPIQ